MENVLALCIDIYHAVGVLAEREPDDDDLNELLYILKATAAIKALALKERQQKSDRLYPVANLADGGR